MRGALQGGLQVHMVDNELLHELFAYNPAEVMPSQSGRSSMFLVDFQRSLQLDMGAKEHLHKLFAYDPTEI